MGGLWVVHAVPKEHKMPRGSPSHDPQAGQEVPVPYPLHLPAGKLCMRETGQSQLFLPFLSIDIGTRTSTCTHIHMGAHMCIHMSNALGAWTYVCMHTIIHFRGFSTLYMLAYMCMFSHIHTWSHMHVCHSFVCTCVNTHAQVNLSSTTHVLSYTFMCACMPLHVLIMHMCVVWSMCVLAHLCTDGHNNADTGMCSACVLIHACV